MQDSRAAVARTARKRARGPCGDSPSHPKARREPYSKVRPGPQLGRTHPAQKSAQGTSHSKPRLGAAYSPALRPRSRRRRAQRTTVSTRPTAAMAASTWNTNA